jgi:hypothetical protein
MNIIKSVPSFYEGVLKELLQIENQELRHARQSIDMKQLGNAPFYLTI